MGRRSVRRVVKKDARPQDDPFRPLNIIPDSDLKKPFFQESDRGVIKKFFRFSDEVEFIIPQPYHRPDDYRVGWITLFEYPFSLGLKFPLPQLVQDYVTLYELPLAQVLPLFWRVLACLGVLGQKVGLEFSVEDLVSYWKPRSAGHGRATLRCMDGIEVPIKKIVETSDKQWISRFIFVRKSTLGPENAPYLFEKWRRIDFPKPDFSKENFERVSSLFDLPEEDRTFPYCLGGSRIKGIRTEISLVSSEDQENSSSSKDVDKAENLQGSVPEDNSNNSSIEKSMSTESRQKGSGKLSTLALLERKRKQTIDTSVQVGVPPVAKRTRQALTLGSPSKSSHSRTTIDLPTEFGEPDTPLWPHLSQLSVPGSKKERESMKIQDLADQACVNSFQALEDCLVFAEKVKKAEEVLRTYEKENSALRRDLAQNKREKEELKKKAVSLEKKVDDLTLQNLDLKAARNPPAVSGKMKDLLLENATYFALKARVETLEEYARGESKTWDVVAARAEFEGFYGGKDMEAWMVEDDDAVISPLAKEGNGNDKEGTGDNVPADKSEEPRGQDVPSEEGGQADS